LLLVVGVGVLQQMLVVVRVVEVQVGIKHLLMPLQWQSLLVKPTLSLSVVAVLVEQFPLLPEVLVEAILNLRQFNFLWRWWWRYFILADLR
jgi:hypothetical protein